ncbi:MAG: SRPBCC family protein [Spirochaetia bacterium]|nr:SRPBCC family protein [Spirochaetia bacterium]
MLKKFLLIFLSIFILVVIVLSATRQSMLHWGTSPTEVTRVMPGDELLPDSVMTSTRAIDINVSPEKVWPWLVQMGQGRGGFYSYDWLESLIGLDIQNTDKIIPSLQNLKKGDLIPFSKAGGINVIEIKPEHLLVLSGTLITPKGTKGHVAGETMVGGTWVFNLEKAGDQSSRLIVRSRIAQFKPVWISKIFMRLLEPAHFIMERKMILGIKERSEKKLPKRI